MKLKQLKYFVEVARTGSQTAASRRLNISQPALGLQIRELEKNFGVKLFERRSRGMELTPAGEVLCEGAERIFQEMENVNHAMRRHALACARTLTLGMPPTPGKLIVPSLLRVIADHGPLSLALHEGLSSELSMKLKTGELDLALTYDPAPSPDCPSEKLAYDDLILVGPPGRLGQGNAPISFHALGAFPMVMDRPTQITRRLLDKLARQENVELEVVLEVDSVSLKREVLLSQAYFAIVPRGLFAEAITKGEFDWANILGPPITRTLYLTARRNLPKEDFRRILKAVQPIVADYIQSGTVNWRRPA